ncbi:MAG: GNAT family N-acetyltransferase [Syntrophothermus sp.]
MHIKVVQKEDEFFKLGPGWDELVRRSPSATVFQSWDWASTWWEHHRRGRKLYIVLVEDDQGRLVGIVPLMRPVIHMYRRFMLLGTGGTDYLDFIIRDGYQKEVLEAVLDHFYGREKGWEILDLQEIPESSSVPQLLPEMAVARGLSLYQQTQSVCPYLELPATVEELHALLSKKFRDNLKYYGRRLEREHAVEYCRLQEPADLEEVMGEFFRLHQSRWLKKGLPGSFLTRRSRNFHLSIARRFLQHGRLGLYLLKVDGAPVAALYSFQDERRAYYYSGGFDPGWERASVGTLLLHHAIKEVIGADLKVFDFLRGDESYKYRWTEKASHNRHLALIRSRFAAPIFLRSLALEDTIVESVKRRVSQR